MNIHLTGCHHSCAQHYIGDIGLIATRVERILKGYLAHRDGNENFLAFSKRHEAGVLKRMFDEAGE